MRATDMGATAGTLDGDKTMPLWSLPAFFSLLVGVLLATCYCPLVNLLAVIALMIAVILISPRLILVAIAIPVLFLCVWTGATDRRGSNHFLILLFATAAAYYSVVLIRSSGKARTARSRNYLLGWGLCCLMFGSSVPLTASFINARLLAGFSSERSQLAELAIGLGRYSQHHGNRFPDKRNWRKAVIPYLSDYERGNDGSDPTLKLTNQGEGYDPDTRQYIYIQPPTNCDYPEHIIMLKAPGWESEIGRSLTATASGETVTKRVWPWWRYLWEGIYE